MPIPPVGDAATDGIVELDEVYVNGLKDLDGFTDCILLYHFHTSGDTAPLEIEAFLNDVPRGIFAVRAPRRPNPIGLSVVEVEAITDEKVIVNGVDVVD